ncbi:MAG: redoxin domain-containing protein [Candidatus Dormiibacterota bacterium]
MRVRLAPRYLALLVTAALVVALGFAVGLLIRPSSPPQGKLLVLLTVDLPLPQNPATLHERAIGLRLLPEAAGSSWQSFTVPAANVTLPGSWQAPNTDSLFLAAVPAGDYRSVELVWRSDSGGLADDSEKLALKVAKSGLTPLLFTFRASSAVSGSRFVDAAAYGGNDQVNFGLQVAQGQVLSVPTVPLVDQSGRSLSLSQYQGKVLVLASFLTQCQDTCPLVAAGLLQLQTLLDQKNLQNQVQIVEVSQDSADDTSTILAKYRQHFSLPWPLLTGTAANLEQFWSQLKVPPLQDEAWDGPAPIDIFTGKAEPFNILHSAVVDVINPRGYVVSELQGQPTLSSSSVPAALEGYLNASGLQDQKAGGAWTPQSLLAEVTPLLQQQGVYTTLPGVVSVGDPAPDFSLPSSAGGNVALSQEVGHPVLIDFWATWCTNCRADMKLVAATADRYKAQGLRVLLVDFEESSGTASKFLKGLGIDLSTLLDHNGQVAQRYGVPGLPVAVFVNSQGKVTAIQLGQLEQAEVNQDMPSALGS